MKHKKIRNGIAALVALAVVAVGANAMAGKGMGYAQDDRGCGGYGQHQRRGDCPRGQGMADLTPEQREQMDAERQAFFEATRNERQDLYAKGLALKAEMANREPDMEKASALQKAVSDLRGSLDQKRLSHIMAMRKINPDAGSGRFMEGRGQGRHGMGHGKGYGSGNCRE